MAHHEVTFTCRSTKHKAIFTSRHPLLTRSVWGRCDLSARELIIRKSLKGLNAIDTLAHEFTHCYFPDLAEDSVNEFSTQLIELLNTCGMLKDWWTVSDLPK